MLHTDFFIFKGNSYYDPNGLNRSFYGSKSILLKFSLNQITNLMTNIKKLLKVTIVNFAQSEVSGGLLDPKMQNDKSSTKSAH